MAWRRVAFEGDGGGVWMACLAIGAYAEGQVGRPCCPVALSYTRAAQLPRRGPVALHTKSVRRIPLTIAQRTKQLSGIKSFNLCLQ